MDDAPRGSRRASRWAGDRTLQRSALACAPPTRPGHQRPSPWPDRVAPGRRSLPPLQSRPGAADEGTHAQVASAGTRLCPARPVGGDRCGQPRDRARGEATRPPLADQARVVTSLATIERATREAFQRTGSFRRPVRARRQRALPPTPLAHRPVRQRQRLRLPVDHERSAHPQPRARPPTRHGRRRGDHRDRREPAARAHEPAPALDPRPLPEHLVAAMAAASGEHIRRRRSPPTCAPRSAAARTTAAPGWGRRRRAAARSPPSWRRTRRPSSPRRPSRRGRCWRR